MAVSYTGHAASSWQTASAINTGALSPSGSEGVVGAGIVWDGSSTITAVTHGSGGPAMSAVSGATADYTTGTSLHGRGYAKAVGSSTAGIWVTWSGAVTGSVLGIVQDGADQTTPAVSGFGTSGNQNPVYGSSPASLTLTNSSIACAVGDMVNNFAFFQCNNVVSMSGISSTSGTEVDQVALSFRMSAAYYDTCDSTSETANATGTCPAFYYSGYGSYSPRLFGIQVGFVIQQSGGGGGEGTGSSSGSATVSGVGQSLNTQPGSSSGTATVSGVGQSSAIADGSSSGVATVSGIGQAALTGVGSSSGTGTVTGVGESLFTGVGSSSGTGTVLGASQSLSEGVGASSGVGTASGIGQSLSEATGASSGSSDVQGYSSSDVSVGSALGTSTVSGVGQSLYTGVGSASGTSDADAEGIAAVVVTAVGNAAGTSSANAEPYTPSRGGGRAKGRNKKKEEIPDYLQRIMEPVPQPKVRPVEKKKTVVTDKIIPFQKPIPQPVVVTAVAKTESPKELIQALMDSIKVQNEKIEALTKLVEAKDREIERLFEELRESLYEEVVALTVTLH